MRLTLPSSLSTRPFSPEAVWVFLSRELVPLIRQMVTALTQEPLTIGWYNDIGTQAIIDLSKTRDAVALLEADSTIALQGGVDGAEGTIVVQQDWIGNHDLAFVCLDRDLAWSDPPDSPQQPPGSVTRYRYLCATIAGNRYLIIEKQFIQTTYAP